MNFKQPLMELKDQIETSLSYCVLFVQKLYINGFHVGTLYFRNLLPGVDSMDWRLMNNFGRIWLKHGHILPGIFKI